jgi:hypothetical protein
MFGTLGPRLRAGLWLGAVVGLCLDLGAGLGLAPAASAKGRRAARGRDVAVVIDLTPGHPVKSFIPNETFGGAIDGMEKGDSERFLQPYNIKKMRSARLDRVTYRTRPELGIEAWHWSAEGSWSDPAHAQGYWTSSDHPSRHENVTWGYSLPRRGDTEDQANNQGYSRLDDGDAASFWKSNPYLDRRYTGLAENRPQWIVLDFEAPTAIEAARIQWGAPWALRYQVQYWTGRDSFDAAGRWVAFPGGDQTIAGPPRDEVLRLAPAPVRTRAVRIMLLESSETAPAGSTDVRDRLGYAVREVHLGRIGPGGRLVDAVRHATDRERQTLIHVSSTDPWHRAVDKDLETEQPGLDLIYGSGVTNGLPLMVPVGVFYDTPENAAAEIRFLKHRGYSFHQVELGEEPDGQFIAPEDYADLFLETAKLLHGIDPALSLGGPSMQGAGTITWPVPEGGRSWIARFVSRLKDRDGLDQFGFFSFEHYPYDSMCGRLDQKLRDNTAMLGQLMADARAGGVPDTIPWVISEYGISPFSGGAMSRIDGALFDVETVGQFLTLGGTSAYMFGYNPDEPINQLLKCAGWGNMMLFDADANGRARHPMPQFHAHWMLTHDWATTVEQPHQLYVATTDVKDAKGMAMVAAYPVRRPDGRWAVMLINRDYDHAHRTRIRFQAKDGAAPFGAGRGIAVVQYSGAQYAYKDTGGSDSHPTRNLPPVRFKLKPGAAIDLPAYSMTVAAGDGPAG